MRALTIDDGALSLNDNAAEPIARPGEVLVRPTCVGVCDTDLQILAGYAGFRGVPGHEFVGEVVQGPAAWLGRRVVADINFACGHCAWCDQGDPHHCPSRTVMGIVQAGGAFAERMVVPERNLLAVPDHVTDQDAVFTEPLAAAFEILQQVDVKPSHQVLVIGDGKLGLLCAQVLATHTARVTVWGHHQAKLDRLSDSDVVGVLEPCWTGRPFDVVVEATGTETGLGTALKMVRPRGTVVLKSTVAAPHTLSLAPLVIDEIRLVGSRCGPFDLALAALADKRVPVHRLVDAVYPLADGVKAFAHAQRRGTLKVLVTG